MGQQQRLGSKGVVGISDDELSNRHGRQARVAYSFRLGRNRACCVLVFYIDGTKVSETSVPPVLRFIKPYFESVRRETGRAERY